MKYRTNILLPLLLACATNSAANQIEIMPEPGRIVVWADAPKGSTLEVRMTDADGVELIPGQVRVHQPAYSAVHVVLDAADLPPGDYVIRTKPVLPDGASGGKPTETPVHWPGQAKEFQGIKILNNLVWELLRAEDETIHGSKTYRFRSPKRRWVYVTAEARSNSGSVRVKLEGHGELLSFTAGDSSSREAMRFLPEGRYKLTVNAPPGSTLNRLVVHSIPEIILHELAGLKVYDGDPLIPPLEFYEAHVNKHVNTLIAAVNSPHLKPEILEFKNNGGRVLANAHAKGVASGIEYCPPEEIFEYIASTAGYTHPLADGTTLDEFSGPCVNCPTYAKALRRLKTSPKHRDKLLYFYDTNIEFNSDEGLQRLQAVLDTDSIILWERYLSTAHDKFLPHPHETAVQDFLQSEYGLGEMARTYRSRDPTAMEHLAVCFGFFSTPGGHMCNSAPSINHNVFLDMQFHFVANDPVYWGTYGLMGYHSSYSDEETLRWLCRLFRHYGIEGNTAPATDDPYVSPHLSNGDFTNGTEGWTMVPAEPDSIRTVHRHGLSALQGRYGSSTGDTGLLTTRSAGSPNAFSQTVKGLQPGRLYTFRMIACDYEDLSKREKVAVDIRLDNVDLISDRSFSTVFPDESFIFPDDHDTWLTYHWFLFRATGNKARVTVSDWTSQKEPGGPIGQQLIFNFLQIHPYFEP